MEHINGIKAFGDYFANCYINALASIMIYHDESYRLAAYMNGYIPHFAPGKDQYFPYMEHNKEFINTFERFFDITEYQFKNDCLDELISLIAEGCYTFVGVDLFYWHDTGPCYQYEHLSHPSLVYGNNADKQYFYTVEDDLGCELKYGIHKIDYIRYLKSVLSRDNDFREKYGYDVRVLLPKKEIEPYEMDINLIKNNAKEILECYEDERFKHFATFGDTFERELPDEYLRVHTKFENRSLANICLFERLEKAGRLSTQASTELIEQCRQIRNYVNTCKMLIYRQKQTGKKFNAELIAQNWQAAIDLERNVWSCFLKG